MLLATITLQKVPEWGGGGGENVFLYKKNEYMPVINHGAKPILLFCKFENSIENSSASEAREDDDRIAYSNLETLSATQHVLVFIR